MPLMWISHADKHSAGLFNCSSLLTSPDPGRRSSSTKTSSRGGKHNRPEAKRNSCTELVWMVVQMLHEEQLIHAEIKLYLRLRYLILQKNPVRPRAALVQQLVDVHHSGTTQRKIRNGQHDIIGEHFRHGSGQIGESKGP